MITADDFICGDKFIALESSDIAYIKTDIIKRNLNEINWRDKIHKSRPARIWITGHSDYSIDKPIFDKYQHNCQKWFTINKSYNNEKIYALPLGITNNTMESRAHQIYGNTDIMIQTMHKPRSITNLVYLNFNVYTFKQDRIPCLDFFKDKSWVTIGSNKVTLKGRQIFLEEIRNHKFAICPRGNGVDTHRLWETLYMGSIPVVIKHDALMEFNDLPILFVDKWEDVTEEFLNNKYDEMQETKWNMDKLKFSYWENLIKFS